MTPDTFHRVMYDNEILCDDKDVKRVVLCAGKVYYDLYEDGNAATSRTSSSCGWSNLSLPQKGAAARTLRFPQADVVWCQEEPKNMGAWTFLDRRLEDVLVELTVPARPRYVGRSEAASPATGNFARHVREPEALVNEALTVEAGAGRRQAAE